MPNFNDSKILDFKHFSGFWPENWIRLLTGWDALILEIATISWNVNSNGKKKQTKSILQKHAENRSNKNQFSLTGTPEKSVWIFTQKSELFLDSHPGMFPDCFLIRNTTQPTSKKKKNKRIAGAALKRICKSDSTILKKPHGPVNNYIWAEQQRESIQRHGVREGGSSGSYGIGDRRQKNKHENSFY